jgi:putative two-component system response regulator
MIMAHDVALTHHEKWNGEGYPNKIKGEDIPLVGRITALADVFDALTSARPYKKPWTLERAVELISSESGHHFDPGLVGLFMEKLPEIREINETYVEPEPSIENNKAWG